MAWFGHTQTLTSISKSVTTVASGILGLESNLATFMQKVTYYDKFFHRIGANLPPEVVATANLLFARCYEYRGEIRDELESSLAYVADAGRWVIGMEDWNSKMDKRLAQISELVLLTNTLLMEYALTGKWGAQGAKEQLHAYLKTMDDSVVLQHEPQSSKCENTKSFGARQAPVVMMKEEEDEPVVVDAAEQDKYALFPRASEPVDAEYDLFPPAKEGDAIATRKTKSQSGEDEELFLARSDSSSTGSDGSSPPPMATQAPQNENDDGDNDALNPFACSYQPPVSIESSLASLRGDSENGSVYFNAMEIQVPHQDGDAYGDDADENEHDTRDGEDDVRDQQDSPVSMGEYECLEMESIPQYVAFRPSALSKKRRLKQQQQQQETNGGGAAAGGSFLSPSSSIESLPSAPLQPHLHHHATPPSSSQTSPRTSPRKTTRRKNGGVVLSSDSSRTGGAAVATAGPAKSRQKLMDLSYSYDFQRELNFNPFSSPATGPATGPATVPAMTATTASEATDLHLHLAPPSPLQLSARVSACPTVQEVETEEEEEPVALEIKEEVFGHLRQEHHHDATQLLNDELEETERNDDDISNFPAVSGDTTNHKEEAVPLDRSAESAEYFSSDGQDELSRILDLLSPDDL